MAYYAPSYFAAYFTPTAFVKAGIAVTPGDGIVVDSSGKIRIVTTASGRDSILIAQGGVCPPACPTPCDCPDLPACLFFDPTQIIGGSISSPCLNVVGVIELNENENLSCWRIGQSQVPATDGDWITCPPTVVVVSASFYLDGSNVIAPYDGTSLYCFWRVDIALAGEYGTPFGRWNLSFYLAGPGAGNNDPTSGSFKLFSENLMEGSFPGFISFNPSATFTLSSTDPYVPAAIVGPNAYCGGLFGYPVDVFSGNLSGVPSTVTVDLSGFGNPTLLAGCPAFTGFPDALVLSLVGSESGTFIATYYGCWSAPNDSSCLDCESAYLYIDAWFIVGFVTDPCTGDEYISSYLVVNPAYLGLVCNTGNSAVFGMTAAFYGSDPASITGTMYRDEDTPVSNDYGGSWDIPDGLDISPGGSTTTCDTGGVTVPCYAIFNIYFNCNLGGSPITVGDVIFSGTTQSIPSGFGANSWQATSTATNGLCTLVYYAPFTSSGSPPMCTLPSNFMPPAPPTQAQAEQLCCLSCPPATPAPPMYAVCVLTVNVNNPTGMGGSLCKSASTMRVTMQLDGSNSYSIHVVSTSVCGQGGSGGSVIPCDPSLFLANLDGSGGVVLVAQDMDNGCQWTITPLDISSRQTDTSITSTNNFPNGPNNILPDGTYAPVSANLGNDGAGNVFILVGNIQVVSNNTTAHPYDNLNPSAPTSYNIPLTGLVDSLGNTLTGSITAVASGSSNWTGNNGSGITATLYYNGTNPTPVSGNPPPILELKIEDSTDTLIYDGAGTVNFFTEYVDPITQYVPQCYTTSYNQTVGISVT
jgi:hypothetical protein